MKLQSFKNFPRKRRESSFSKTVKLNHLTTFLEFNFRFPDPNKSDYESEQQEVFVFLSCEL